jgi:hypothetical protein
MIFGSFIPPKRNRDHGVALVIVMAFVLLLTVLVVAYFSRVTSDRQFAAGYFGDAAADLLARSAMNVVVGDFKQEIINGSTAIPTGSSPVTYYLPSVNANVIPQRNVPASAGVPNLIRISVRSDPLTGPAIGSRASAINSTGDPSLNGRLISASRWNKHCLIPMGNPTTADTDPSPIPTFGPPDWVYVTAQGPAPAPLPTKVFGRYAYAVYNEGGLLDMNVVGFPSPTPAASPVGRKGIATFADMRALPYNSSAIPGAVPTSTASFTAIGQIVAWRNNATLQASPGSNFPSWLAVTPTSATNFLSIYLSPTFDFISPSTSAYNPVTKGTDQVFITRSELLNLNKYQISANSAFDSNTLGFIGTFSRERNAPTFWLRTGASATASPLANRFPIGNLDVVVPGSSNATITQNFGLQWVANPSPTPSRWRYVTPRGVGSPAPPASDIGPPTASSNDFFQLLRYSRSTGTSIPSVAETLAIGAAIIDQYDADTTTTQIEYADPATGAILVAYGMEANDPARPVGTPTPAPTPPAGYKMLPTPTPSNAWDRPMRNTGEFGYAYSAFSPNPSKTLDFFTSGASNGDARLLDIFTFNTASPRAGQVDLNTQNDAVLAALLRGAWTSTSTGSGLSASAAASAAAAIVVETRSRPAMGREDIARICAATGVGSAIGPGEEAQEVIARVLGETCTTRTWGLLIDVIAQSGHCKPNATTLADFAVDGEKRYWLHVAIDRFNGDILDQQLEEVLE